MSDHTTNELRAVASTSLVLIPNPRLTNMKSAPLAKGQSQLEVKATLRHRAQVNDCVKVTFDVEPSDEAMERYVGWAARILDNHSTRDRIAANNEAGVWKTKYKAAERALRAVLEHIAPIVDDFERGPLMAHSENPVIASIRALLADKRDENDKDQMAASPQPTTPDK